MTKLMEEIERIASTYQATPHAERHLLRRRIASIYRELHPDADVYAANRFAASKVPPYVGSYPLSKREVLDPLSPDPLGDYARKSKARHKADGASADPLKNTRGESE